MNKAFAANHIRAIVVALLAFVLVFAPVSHAIAMPAGHQMTDMVKAEATVEKTSENHHQAAQDDVKQKSSCEDSSGQSKPEKNCCEVGCLTIATISGGSDLFVANLILARHVSSEDQLHSRVLNGLKRPPRA